MMNGKHPAAVKAAIDQLTKLASTHGLGAVNTAYAEAVSEMMAGQARDEWRARIALGQQELALPLLS